MTVKEHDEKPPVSFAMRWTACADYTDNSMLVAEVDEIEDLQEIMENGPDWNTLNKLVITYNFKVVDDDS